MKHDLHVSSELSTPISKEAWDAAMIIDGGVFDFLEQKFGLRRKEGQALVIEPIARVVQDAIDKAAEAKRV